MKHFTWRVKIMADFREKLKKTKENLEEILDDSKEDLENYFTATVTTEKRTWKILFTTLVKWILISIPVGGIIGFVASYFLIAIEYIVKIHEAHPWLVLCLPIGGVLIVFLYRGMGQAYNTGTNQVMTVMRAQEEKIPWQISPLIVFSTLTTLFFGGSTGREGAALQLGASISDSVSRGLKLGESDKRIVIFAGMSAAFSALFGTPMAATIFPMEVISVGIIYYAALVPCVLSAFIAHFVSAYLRLHTLGAPFAVAAVPTMYGLNALKTVALAVICAMAAYLFCASMRIGERTLGKIKNQYYRAVIGGLMIVALYFIFGTDRYMSLGVDYIYASFKSPAQFYDFAGKILFTVITLCAGFKGGEIVPTLFIGATLGSFLSVPLGMDTTIATACGMSALFCGVTNCPIASLLLSFELFGYSGAPYYCIVVAISYLMSGYRGLYKEQKIIYSKTENKYVDRQAL